MRIFHNSTIFPVTPTQHRVAPEHLIVPDYQYSNTNQDPYYANYDADYYAYYEQQTSSRNPHLQWQRQPVSQPEPVREPVRKPELQPAGPPAGWTHNQGVSYVTKTVSGFMDFVTTVGNTVMVFTPQAGPSKTGKIGSNHLSSLCSIITQLREIRTVS